MEKKCVKKMKNMEVFDTSKLIIYSEIQNLKKNNNE